jgi:hypothetical protein
MRSPYAVHVVERWDPRLDGALAQLPEMPSCPHELYRTLAASLPARERLLALVERDGEAVALLALRRQQRHWRLVTDGVVPSPAAPCVPGELLPALRALRRDIWVGAQDAPPPRGVPVSGAYAIQNYRMPATADFEAFWHETGMWGMIKRGRQSTRRFGIRVDEGPPAAEWTLRQWARRWQSQETRTLPQLLIAAEHLQRRGLYHTFRMFDGDEPIGGYNFQAVGPRLVFQTTWYDERYATRKVGARLFEYAFFWARDNGFDEIDIGGGHDYKALWAPPRGELWAYNLCPWPRSALKRARSLAASLARRSRPAAHNIGARRAPPAAVVVNQPPSA